MSPEVRGVRGSVFEPRRGLVSVIIIYFNAERFLREAVDSVLAQTYPDWELILVDDGSVDGSTAIGKQLASQHSSIRYVEHDGHANRGMSAARNAGVREARGEFIAFLDADDVWLPHKLAQQVAILRARPDAALVYGRTLYWHGWTGVAEDALRDYEPAPGVPENTLFPPPALALLLYPLGTRTAPSMSGLMVRRQAIIDVDGFEESFTGFYEDQAFLIKVYLQHHIYVAGERWDCYRIHDASCSAHVARAGLYDTARASFLEWLADYLERRGDCPRTVATALHAALQAARDRPAQLAGIHPEHH